MPLVPVGLIALDRIPGGSEVRYQETPKTGLLEEEIARLISHDRADEILEWAERVSSERPMSTVEALEWLLQARQAFETQDAREHAAQRLAEWVREQNEKATDSQGTATQILSAPQQPRMNRHERRAQAAKERRKRP